MSDWRYCYCCLLSSEYKIDLIITTISTYSQSIAETFINLGQYRISIKIQIADTRIACGVEGLFCLLRIPYLCLFDHLPPDVPNPESNLCWLSLISIKSWDYFSVLSLRHNPFAEIGKSKNVNLDFLFRIILCKYTKCRYLNTQFKNIKPR